MKHLLLTGAALLLLAHAAQAQVAVQPGQPVPIGRPIRPIGPPGIFPGGGGELPIVKVTKEQLPKLLKDLESEEPEVLLTTVVSLGELGPDAKQAVPGLIKALSVKNEDVRLNTAIALSRVGKAAIPDLTRALTSEDTNVRFYSIWALGWIGPDAKDSAEAVLSALTDKDNGVRRKAVYALGRIDADPKAAVPALLKAINDEKDEVRTAAAEAVAKYPKEAVPELVKLLARKEAVGRQDAINALGHVGVDAKAAIPELSAILETEPALGNAISEALGKIGREAIPALEKALKNEKQDVRLHAVMGLSKVGVNAGQSLVDALESKHVDVRRLAAQVLGPLNIGDKMVVLGLAHAVRDSDDTVKQFALSSLQQLGQNAKLAAPKLREALLDSSPGIRQQAFWTLQNIGEDPRAGLKKGLESKDERVRINTAALMCQVHFDQQQAAPILKEALKHKELELRMTAAHALAMTRQELGALVPVLVEALRADKSSTRLSALQALNNLGGLAQAQAAIPGVLDCLKDEEPQCKIFAVYAIQNLNVNAKIALPALEKALEDKDVNVRRTIVGHLHRFQKEALPLYLKGIEDKDSSVRQQSIYGMQNLRGQEKDKVLPVMKKLAADKDANVRMAVLQVVQQYGKDATPVLIDFLKDENQNVKQQSLWMLAQQANNNQSDIKPALPALVALMKENNPNYQWALMQLLPRAGKDALPLVLENLASDNEGTQQACIQALAQMRNLDRTLTEAISKQARENKKAAIRSGALLALARQENEFATEAATLLKKEGDTQVYLMVLQGLRSDIPAQNVKVLMPFVVDKLKDKDANLKAQALQACARLGASAGEAVSPLVGILKDGPVNDRINAARALGNMGAAAREAIPALEAASKDGNRQVASAAQLALRRIKNPPVQPKVVPGTPPV